MERKDRYFVYIYIYMYVCMYVCMLKPLLSAFIVSYWEEQPHISRVHVIINVTAPFKNLVNPVHHILPFLFVKFFDSFFYFLGV